MKKSITISVAIIFIVIILAIYQAIHHHFTAFDAMLFSAVFFIGGCAGASLASISDDNEETAEAKEDNNYPYYLRALTNNLPDLMAAIKQEREGVEL